MKSFFKKLALVLSAAMVITLMPAAPAKAADSKSLVIAKQNESKSVSGVELNVGKTVDLKFLGASDWKALGWTWASADKAVAEVNQSGLVTAKAPGFTTVSITVPGYNVATVGIFVNGDNINSLKLGESAAKTATAFSLDVNKTIDLNFYGATGYKASDTVKWTSSNTSVATVNARGLVTAVGAGTTTVRVGVNVASTGKSYIGTAVITVKGIEGFSAKQVSTKGIEVTFASSRDALGTVNIYRGLKQIDGSYFYIDWALESKTRKDKTVTLTSFVDLGEAVYKIVSGSNETIIETGVGDPATVSVSYGSSYWSEDGEERNNKPVLVVKDKNGIILDNTKYSFIYELVDTSDEDAFVEDDGTLLLYNKKAKATVKAILAYDVEDGEETVTKEISSTVTVNAVTRPAYALEAVTGTAIVNGGAKTKKSDVDKLVNDSYEVILGNGINSNDYGVFGLIADSYGNTKSFGRINCLSYPCLGTAGDDAENFYVRFSTSDNSKVFVDPLTGQIIGVTETPEGKPGYVFVTLYENVEGEAVNRGIISAIPVNVKAPRSFAKAELDAKSAKLFTSVPSQSSGSLFGELFFTNNGAYNGTYSGSNAGNEYNSSFVKKVVVNSFDTLGKKMSAAVYADECDIESVSAFYKDKTTKIEYEFGDHSTDPSKTFVKCVTINNGGNGNADENKDSNRYFIVYGFNINTDANTEGNKDLNKNEDGARNNKIPGISKLDFVVTLKNGTQMTFNVELQKVNDIRYVRSTSGTRGAYQVVSGDPANKATQVKIDAVRLSIPDIQVGDYVKEKTQKFSIVAEKNLADKFGGAHSNFQEGVFHIYRDLNGLHYMRFDNWTRNTNVRDNAANRYVGRFFVSVVGPDGKEIWADNNGVYRPGSAGLKINPILDKTNNKEYKFIPDGTYKIELRRITSVDGDTYKYSTLATYKFDFNRVVTENKYRFVSSSNICFNLERPLLLNGDENNGVFIANDRIAYDNNSIGTDVTITYPEGSLIYLPGGNSVYVKTANIRWLANWNAGPNGAYLEKEVDVNKIFYLASGKHQVIPGYADFAGFGAKGTAHTGLDVFNDSKSEEIYGSGDGDWFANIMDFGEDEVNVLRLTPQLENKTHTGGWRIYVIDPAYIENCEYTRKDPQNGDFHGNVASIVPGTGSYDLSHAKLIGEYQADITNNSKSIKPTVDIWLDEPLTGTQCILFVAYAADEDSQAANLHYIAFYEADRDQKNETASRSFMNPDYSRVIQAVENNAIVDVTDNATYQSKMYVAKPDYEPAGIYIDVSWNRIEKEGLDDAKKAEIEEHIKSLESYGLDEAYNVAFSNNCLSTQYFESTKAVFVFEDVDFGTAGTGIDTHVFSHLNNCIMTGTFYIDGEADGDITNATYLGEIVDIRSNIEGNPNTQTWKGNHNGRHLTLPIHFAPVSGKHRVTFVADVIANSPILYNFTVH